MSSYFFGKLISDLLPMRILPSIIFTCIIYFLLGKQHDKRYVSLVLDMRAGQFVYTSMFLVLKL